MNDNGRIKILGYAPGELLLTAARLQLGAWMIVNGLNHWLPIFPQPLGSTVDSQRLLVALIESGLFDLVKAVEVVGGILLILNLYVPLALLMLLPISIVVYYFDAVLQQRWNRILYMGVLCFYINLALLVAYVRYYFPMLTPWSQPGTWRDVAGIPDALRGRTEPSQEQ
jgi:uncharacterized membrane protein YphA (DoxX/SURF4 family)